MKQKYAWLFKAAQNLKGTEIVFKPEWQAYQCLIGGKMFAYVGDNNRDKEIVTLKGDPAHNILMIEIYDSITEGYYMNKIHWISIQLNDPNPLNHEIVIELLTKAYDLVFNKLTKKMQHQIMTQ